MLHNFFLLSTSKISNKYKVVLNISTLQCLHILKDSDFEFSSKIYILTFTSGDSLGEHEIPRKPAFTKMLS